MKTTIFKVAISTLMITTISFVSCKKDDPEPTPVAPVVNTLCDGNSTTSYYPLVLNNSWTYSYMISTQVQSVHPNLVVTGTSLHNTLTYFQVADQTSAMYQGQLELREASSTHNIYYYDSNTAAEFLYVPNSPTLNQSWTFAYTHTRKVTSTNASISTSNCSYTGLLEISEYDNASVLLQKDYFKRGLGMVHREDVDTFFGGFDKFSLTNVTLH